MTYKRRKRTLRECLAEALEYKTRSDWARNGHCYSYAQSRRWIDRCCRHMESKRTHWTLEKCKEHAKIFNTRSEWQKGHGGSYDWARRNKCIDLCAEHMTSAFVPKANKECILEVASSKRSTRKGIGRKLNRSLANYTHKQSSAYDPIFDEKIRKLRPDWFRKFKKAAND